MREGEGPQGDSLTVSVGKQSKILVLCVCFVIVALLFVSLIYATTQRRAEAPVNFAVSGVAVIPEILHPVRYAEEIENSSFIMPDLSILGSSFSIIGVSINTPPTNLNVTEANGSLAPFTYWSVTFFLWNGTFVNGTTTNVDIFESGGMAIVETPSSANQNSTSAEEQEIQPEQACNTNSNITTCYPFSSSRPSYLEEMNGLSVIVSPSNNNLTWLDDRQDIWVNIVGGAVPMSKLLELAEQMTYLPSSPSG